MAMAGGGQRSSFTGQSHPAPEISMMRRPLLAAFLATLVALSAGPAHAQTQAEIEFLQRRVDEIRDPRFRRMANDELLAAREALRQNNAEEFRQRSENVARLARFDEFQYRR
jgi:hypothetical protein